MSINAINSVSLYEYYYRINKKEQEKKESPLADEMRKYGLVPTDNENLNIQLLKNAKDIKRQQETQEKQEIPYSQRPWADLMYQLNIQFNEDPKDDIEDIKDELALLTRGMDDEELNREIRDLESYVENLYINFQQIYTTNKFTGTSINAQLNNLAMINQANLL
ncbi:MAG: hypothetical protein IJB79_01835 [Candidatus Gastranaerophilales bacterium]|nr:hypothetical protein [Candidatus Gastranaerophilales bacterium]